MNLISGIGRALRSLEEYGASPSIFAFVDNQEGLVIEIDWDRRTKQGGVRFTKEELQWMTDQQLDAKFEREIRHWFGE
jgi:hypothetical protein